MPPPLARRDLAAGRVRRTRPTDDWRARRDQTPRFPRAASGARIHETTSPFRWLRPAFQARPGHRL